MWWCDVMNYKYDVFLSYSSFDNVYAEQIRQNLIENKIKVYESNKLFTGASFKESIENAIENTEYFVFICTRQGLMNHYNNICCPNGGPFNFVDEEILFASKCAINNGLKILPVIITETTGDENIDYLVEDIFLKTVKSIKCSNIEYIQTTLVNIIAKNRKIVELFSKAEQAWNYGAYEQAYNYYLSLVGLVDGEAKLNCYDRAANCCEKVGKWEEAKKLYHLSNNEQALKRVKNNTKSKEPIKPKEVNQELLYKIANYCDASIDLFYELLKDNQSPEGLNCLKTSYTRLLNYCKIIGGMDDVISSALSKMKESEKEFAKGNLVTEETKIDIIKPYRTYLGLEFPESDNYDVFISYKSEDEMLARRVYDYLLSEGKRVFFACEVLPDMGKTEYRDAIMDALDHSQHFVLVTSKLDYITSNWVKEEWSFYVSKLIEDNHKGNITIIVHDDFKVDKNQLPPNLRYKQRLLMSNFKESLLKYLQQ